MQPMISKTIAGSEEKTIAVCCCNIEELDEPIDIMTVSAFFGSYAPTKGTLMAALDNKGVNIESLAKAPTADLRKSSKIWVSEEISGAQLPISRIGCVELSQYTEDRSDWLHRENEIISSIRSYFRLIEILSLSGVKTDVVGIPVFGGGKQCIATSLVGVPIISECMQLLKRCSGVKKILIITNNPPQAFEMAQLLEKSYSVNEPADVTVQRTENRKMAFISYSSKDKALADELCVQLESRGLEVWYAPRNITTNDYASAIVQAIRSCDYFIVILSESSVKSYHVLNEIDLGFAELRRNVRFKPVKVDKCELGAAFMYYINRIHWFNALGEPSDTLMSDFAESLFKEDCYERV